LKTRRKQSKGFLPFNCYHCSVKVTR